MILGIHGYNFSPIDGDTADGQFDLWENFAPSLDRWHWQSIPKGSNRAVKLFRAWLDGYPNTYYWTWGRSIVEAYKVAAHLDALPNRIDIVCHSLGSRVAYEACRLRPWRVRKVLALNGADSAEHARACALKAPNVEFHSALFKGDKVLGIMGRAFTPKLGFERVVGYDGMDNPPDNFNQIILTPGEGDDPDDFGDHSYSFTNPALWERWRELLAWPRHLNMHPIASEK